MSACPVFGELACQCGSFVVESFCWQVQVRVTLDLWPISRTDIFSSRATHAPHVSQLAWSGSAPALTTKQAAFPANCRLPQLGQLGVAAAEGREGEAAKAAQSKTDFVSRPRHNVVCLRELVMTCDDGRQKLTSHHATVCLVRRTMWFEGGSPALVLTTAHASAVQLNPNSPHSLIRNSWLDRSRQGFSRRLCTGGIEASSILQVKRCDSSQG